MMEHYAVFALVCLRCNFSDYLIDQSYKADRKISFHPSNIGLIWPEEMVVQDLDLSFSGSCCHCGLRY